MSYTTNYNLEKPSYNTLNWNIPLNSNFDIIDTEIKNRVNDISTINTQLSDIGIDLKLLGVIGDGNSHPLSTIFSTLVEAQSKYPNAVDLTDEIDWCITQYALNNYKKVYAKDLSLVINRTLQMDVNGEFTLNSNSNILIYANVDGISLNTNVKLTGGNIRIKIQGYTHSCILVDGSFNFQAQNALVEKISIYGLNYDGLGLGVNYLEGNGIKLQVLNNENCIMNVQFRDIRISCVNNGIYLNTAKTEGVWNWITGCGFSDFFINWAKTAIRLEGTTQNPHQCSGNIFNNVQSDAKPANPDHPEYDASEIGIYCEGGENSFINCFSWDYGNPNTTNTAYHFTSTSEYNLIIDVALSKNKIIDEGLNNMYKSIFFNSQIEDYLNNITYASNETLPTMLGIQDNVLAFIDLLGGTVTCEGDQPDTSNYPIKDAFRNHIGGARARWYSLSNPTTITIIPAQTINVANVLVIYFEHNWRPQNITVSIYSNFTWTQYYTSSSLTEDKIAINMYQTNIDQIKIVMQGMQGEFVSIASVSMSSAVNMGTSFLPTNGGKLVGNLEVSSGGNVVLSSPNNTKYKLVVNDSGVLSVEAL